MIHENALISNKKWEKEMKVRTSDCLKATAIGILMSIAMAVSGVQANDPTQKIDTKPASEEKLEVGALTEWDPLKEVIIGGYDGQWPEITQVEWSSMEASMPPEVRAEIKSREGKDQEKDLPELYAEFKKEVEDLNAIFEKLGVKVYSPRKMTKADLDLYGSSTGLWPFFPRDMFVTHKNKIIFSSLAMPMHQKAQQVFYEIMNEKANSSDLTEMIAVPIPNFEVKDGAKKSNNVPLLDGGDVMFFGQKVFVGIAAGESMGSNQRGVVWLQKVLGDEYDVIAVPLDKRFFHLDLALSAPKEGLIMYAPEAFTSGLPEYFNDWDKIEVTSDQAMHGALNGLPVDSANYILGFNEMDDMKWLVPQMEEKGINVHLVWFHQHNKLDGSIRCATQQLLRVPEK